MLTRKKKKKEKEKGRKRRIRMWKVRCDYRRNKYTRGGRRNGRENVVELASGGNASETKGNEREEKERKP